MEHQSLLKASELLEVLENTKEEARDLPSTLQHIAQVAQSFFNADNTVVFAISPINSKFIDTLTIVGDLLTDDKLLYEQLGPQGLAQKILDSKVVVVAEIDSAPQYQNTFTRLEGISSFAALPLRMKYRQKPLGLLYVNFRKPQQFDEDSYELFQLFADQSSFILQETWLLQRYQEVAHIGQEINQELSTANALFQRLQSHMSDILDTSHAFFLAVHQPQTNTLDLYLEDEGEFFIKENDSLEGASGYVLDTQETLFIRHMSEEAEHLSFERVQINTRSGAKEALIFIPLIFRGVSLGILSVQHEHPYAYDHEDLFILQLLANHIALALYNMRLYNNLNLLNEAGQLLTQQVNSEHVLQATSDKIQQATKADIVVLYPYDAGAKRFMFSPNIAGTLYASSAQSMFPSRPDDLAMLTLQHLDPIFAKESAAMYAELDGDVGIRQGNFQEREGVASTAAMPLRVGDIAVGVLFINFRHAQRFDASQKLLIEGLAHFAAIAIKNAQEYGSLLQRRLQELEVLQRIDRELNRNIDLESTLQTLLDLACERIPAKEAAIALYNVQLLVLELATVQGRNSRTRRKLNIPLREIKGITRWVLENKQPVRIGNVHKEYPWRELYFQTTDDTLSELDVPLLDGDEVIGVLNFESTEENAFRQEDEDFLRTLAGQAILAIKNAQAYEREKRLAEEERVINEISKEIIASLDTSTIFDLILDKAIELTNSSTGVLMLYDRETNDLNMVVERGVIKEKKGQRIKLDEGVIGYVSRNRKPLNVDPSQAPWNTIYLDYILGTRSELAVPMLVGDELHGVIDVESPSPTNFKEDDVRLLSSLADLAVVALQHAQAYEREKRLSEEARVLNEISKGMIGQLDLVRVFEQILNNALELTHSTSGTLELYDANQNKLDMVAEKGVVKDRANHHLGLDQGIVGYVARNKRMLNVDPSQAPWNTIYLDSIPGTRSELAVPILAGDEIRGVLNIESTEPGKFTESDVRLIQALADLTVIAIQNAEQYKNAEDAAQRFELLYKAGEELSKITESAQLEQAYEVILSIAKQQSQSQVTLRRYDEEKQELVLISGSQHQKFRTFANLKLSEGLNGQVAREQRTIIVDDVLHPPQGVAVQLPDPAIRSLVVIPIRFKNRYYGNLGLSHEEINHFHNTDINFYEGLVQQLASTIYRLEIADERQELEQRTLSAEEMSSIGQSAFEITHRLGNDLGLVGSYVGDIEAELAEKDFVSLLVSRKLKNIVNAVRTVLDLSGNLKEELARSGMTEKTAGGPVTIDTQALLEQVQQALPMPATIQMSLEIEDDLAPVYVIPGLVIDILRNLITNAIEAMPTGGKIILRARNAGRSIVVEVVDTGVGISKQKQSKIFDLFFSTKGSSGFGLWSARRYALRNHGDLKVESQPGQGTTFTLLLPRSVGTDMRIL